MSLPYEVRARFFFARPLRHLCANAAGFKKNDGPVRTHAVVTSPTEVFYGSTVLRFHDAPSLSGSRPLLHLSGWRRRGCRLLDVGQQSLASKAQVGESKFTVSAKSYCQEHHVFGGMRMNTRMWRMPSAACWTRRSWCTSQSLSWPAWTGTLQSGPCRP